VPAGHGEVVVLCGGDAVPAALATDLPVEAWVVAADGGLHLAAPLGLRVDLVVGDLDSVDPTLLAEVEAAGTPVDRYPVDKERTDLAIALDAAVSRDPRRITVVGGGGGRADHLLANGLLVAADAYAGHHLRWWTAAARTDVVRPEVPIALHGAPGDLVTLLAVHGPARGVTTEGLAFPLTGETLAPGSSRGVSNRFAGQHATVRLTDGALLAVRPQDRRCPADPGERP
jgi:thiamine pyrophosphokinase